MLLSLLCNYRIVFLSSVTLFSFFFIFLIFVAGDTELLKYLLSKGVNPDLESDSGTPLVWAAGHAQPDAVSVLLEHGANVCHLLLCCLFLVLFIGSYISRSFIYSSFLFLNEFCMQCISRCLYVPFCLLFPNIYIYIYIYIYYILLSLILWFN